MYADPTVNVVRFDSIVEMATYGNKAITCPQRRGGSERAFHGSTGWKDMLARCAAGYDALVPKARELMEKLEGSISTSANALESSVAGAFPCTPAFVSGDPESMFEAVSYASDVAPLSIFVDLSSSANIREDQFMTRGVAVLALTMALSAVRPITLNAITSLGSSKPTEAMQRENERYSIVVCRIETAPLDLTRAAFILTDVAVARRLFYGIGEAMHDFNGMWPTFSGVTYGNSYSKEYDERLRAILGESGETLFVPALSQYEKQSSAETNSLLQNPTEWINRKLRQYGGLQD